MIAVAEGQSKEAEPPAKPGVMTLTRVIWLCLFLVASTAVYSVNHIWTWLDRPITQIKVFGEVKNFDAQEAVSRWLPPASHLLSVDLRTLHQEIEKEPWVARTEMVKNWPSTLELYVTEEQAIARWGQDGLLNANAKVFWPKATSEDQKLPYFSGPDGSEQQVVAQYHYLNTLLRPKSLSLQSLSLEPRGSWTFTLSNGTKVKLGMEDMSQRLSRFLSLYERVLQAKMDEVASVDLRYTNGAAVAWINNISETERN